MIIYIDFETRSTSNLKKEGQIKYSLDHNTEVLCAGLIVDNNPLLLTPDKFDWRPDPNAIYIAHNAGFEIAIWANKMHPLYGWPLIPLSQWRCTAAKAAACGLPRGLKAVAKALSLEEQKDARGERAMRKLSKPRPKWTKTGEGPKWFGSPQEFEILYKYCIQDVYTGKAIDEALPNLSPTEQKVWELDQQINQRGIVCDIQLATTCVELSQHQQVKADKKLEKITDGKIKTSGQVLEIAKWCDLPNVAAKTVDKALRQNPTPKIKEVLEIRKSNSKSSIKKYQAMLTRACDDNRIRDNLVYHKAHTGRWAGEGMQGQNLIRPKFDRLSIEDFGIPAILDRDIDAIDLLFGSTTELMSSAVRSTLCAQPGYHLIGADYSSIEACVLLWLADDQKSIDLIKSGYDLYIDMAASIYNKPYSEVTEKERELGKQAILGLGYSMWALKFCKTCRGYGIEIEPIFAEQVVRIYRSKYRKIVEYWYALDRLARGAMMMPNKKFRLKDNFLQMKLRSGRILNYPYPKIIPGKFGQPSVSYLSSKGMRTDMYGGKWAEHETQATARDIMAHGMLRVDPKYPIILSVHDEVISEIPENKGSVQEYEQLLCKPEPWNEGCPIKAKGWRGLRYRK